MAIAGYGRRIRCGTPRERVEEYDSYNDIITMSENPYVHGPDKPLFKAYNNKEFLNSPDARVIRIMAEYMEPVSRLEREHVDGAVVFFGSARIDSREVVEQKIANAKAALEQGAENAETLQGELKRLERKLQMSRYYEEAAELARRITEWADGVRHPQNPHCFLICSGGGPGIMEAANRGAHASEGMSIGLNISLPFEQVPNNYISATLNFEFHYFFMRKLFFMSLANAVVVFPGGFGTLDEFMEVLTLIQTAKVTKDMPIVLYGTEFWDNVINFDYLAEMGMISPEDLNLFHRADTVEDAFSYLTEKLAEFHEVSGGHDPDVDPGHIKTDMEDK